VGDGSNGYSLTKSGNATLILTAASTYTGGTIINGGTILLANNTSVSHLGVNGALTIHNSGTLDLRGVNTTIDSLNGDAGTTITNNFSGAGQTLTIGNSGGGGVFQGTLQNGTGGLVLTKTGVGVIELSGTNTYTGMTTISGGMLALGTANSLPGGIGNTGGTSHLRLDGGVLGASGTFSRSVGATSATTVDLGFSTGSFSGFAGFGTAAGFGGTNNLIVNLGGSSASITWGNNSSGNGGTANFLGSGDTLLLGNSGANGTVTFQNPLSLNTNTSSNTSRTVQVDRSSVAGTNDIDAILSGVISGGNDLFKTGAGTLQLTGTNTYAGATKASAGILSVSSIVNGGINSGIGASSNAAANLILDGGTLQYTGGSTSSDRLFTLTNNSGTIDASGSGAITFAGNGANAIAFSGSGARTLTLTGSNAGSNTLASIIGTGTGGATSLAKTGNGTWVLTGANTYAGSTTISGGTLQLGNGSTAGSLSTGSAIIDNANFTINRSDAISQGTQFSSSAITGTGSFTQAGAGTTTLNAANSYQGATTVTSGTLKLDSAGSTTARLANTSGITVNSGGTLLLTNSTGTTSNDRIGDSATMKLNGGTFNTGGLSEHGATNNTAGLGALTLQSTSTIDMGSGASIVAFANSNSLLGNSSAWSGTLNIYDWTGNVTGGGTDQLFVGNDNTGVNASQLAEIQFFSGNNTGSYGVGAMILANGEIVPIPETSTWICGSLSGLMLIVQILRARSFSKRAENIQGRLN
jgi:fibronectin-binding autotransporter adhesin